MGISLRAKLACGFGVILLIFAVTGTFAMLAMRAQRATLSMLGRHELPTISLLQEVSLGMQLYRKAEKDILLNLGDAKALNGYMGKLNELAALQGNNLRLLQNVLRGNPQAGPSAEALAQEAAQAFASYDAIVRPTSAERQPVKVPWTQPRPTPFILLTKTMCTPQKKIWRPLKRCLWRALCQASRSWRSRRAARKRC